MDGKPHDVAISLTENDRQITVQIDDEEVINVNLDTAEDGKYAAFEIEPTGGYMFQAMNCEATFSNIKIWGNDMEKNIVQPTGVELNKNTLTMEVGDTEYLRAKKIPTNAESEIVWESSDPTVATVNETGMVTALKAGSVTITAKIRGYEEIKAECAVTVAGDAPAEGGGCSCGGNEVAGIASLAVIAAAAGLKRFF